MDFLKKWSVFSILVVALFVGCNNDETEPSVVTTIRNLYLTSADSVASVNNALFYVNADTFFVYKGVEYTGFIQNRDSMLYGSSLKAVIPTIITKAVVSTIVLNDSITYSGSDTMDFEMPVKVLVYAQNADTTQLYLIKSNVHQIDHELYLWDERSYPTTTSTIKAEKAVFFSDKIFLFRNINNVATLDVSADFADEWQSVSLDGIVADAIDHIICADKFYAVSDDKFFVSADGRTWTSHTIADVPIKRLLFKNENTLFALTQDSVVMSSDEGVSWQLAYRCTDDFPMQDYSVVAEKSPSGRMRYLLVGGTAKNGAPAGAWSTENGTYWVNFSQDGNNLPCRQNAATIAYDHNVLMFGGEENGIVSDSVLLSPDFGFTWTGADDKIVARNYVPTIKSSIFSTRKLSNASKNQYRIFIVGGKDKDGDYVQKIWTSRKNETYFDEYR